MTASFFSGTHCLIEWNEPGNPRNVVPRKSVQATGERLRDGEMCDVEIRIGSKRSLYEAQVLGIGEIHIHLCIIFLGEHYLQVHFFYWRILLIGEKRSMDRMLTELEKDDVEECSELVETGMTDQVEPGEPGEGEVIEPGETGVTDQMEMGGTGVTERVDMEETAVTEPVSAEEELFHPEQDDSADPAEEYTPRSRKRQPVSIIKHANENMLCYYRISIEQKEANREEKEKTTGQYPFMFLLPIM